MEALHAYMPSPDSDMIFFKRMLQKMQPGAVDPAWFPWGVPPIQRIIDCVQAIEGERAPLGLFRRSLFPACFGDEGFDFARQIPDLFELIHPSHRAHPRQRLHR